MIEFVPLEIAKPAVAVSREVNLFDVNSVEPDECGLFRLKAFSKNDGYVRACIQYAHRATFTGALTRPVPLPSTLKGTIGR